MEEVMHLDDEAFDETIVKYPLVVVDFWAEWCMPCKMIAPVIDELVNELSGKVVFAKINIDEDRAAAAKFGISSIPTLLIFKNGKPVDKIVGAVPKQQIEEKIQMYL
ncbi:MAG: thioredoxin [Candidatus Altiarchaeales archaeon WOR_SM1_86-2]|nr:MAG: thioredoxin [Candidatus Altiarchaeales archaeon WOR_SM1_86-2]